MSDDVTSRPESGSSKMTICGLCRSAAEIRIFCRMPFEYAKRRMLVVRETEDLEEGTDLPPQSGVRERSQLAHQLQVFRTGQIVVQVSFFRDVPDPRFVVDQRVSNIDVVEIHAAAGGLQQPGQD